MRTRPSARGARSWQRDADTGTLVGTAHVPLPPAGRIVADGDAFRFAYEDMDW
jgi:hypothetical protein